jgi:hypothetical protein
MKNNVMQAKFNVLRSGIYSAILLVILFVSLVPQVATAQGGFNETPTPATIKYIGFLEEKLLFNVNIENKEAERCWISIVDEHGEVFFKQEFKDAKYTKTFGISKEEIEGKNLVFVLVKGKSRHEHVFNVTTNTRVVEDVVVAKQ